MQDQIDVSAVWEKVVDQVKHKVIHPTLWRTLEIAVPVTTDETSFVVGFKPANFNMSGHLTSSEHKNAIESAIEQFTGKRLNLRIIEGETIADWKALIEKEKNASRLAEATRSKREREYAAAKTWDTMYEQVGRGYASLTSRQLPQSKAIYIESIIEDISDTMDDLMPAGKPTDDLAERSLARIIDRVGSLTDVPPAIVALELKRYREKNK
ncbi:MAG: hypothetical protein ACYC27_06465 [Armatimonadota bacterium]